jgi:hypothetical protein
MDRISIDDAVCQLIDHYASLCDLNGRRKLKLQVEVASLS